MSSYTVEKATTCTRRFGMPLLDKFHLASGNVRDPYAVTVVERGVIVGHVPQAISSVCFLFLGRNSTLTCQVTGARHYSINLPQGGLEIPCKLIFYGESRLIVKVQNLLQEALTSGLLTSCNMDSECQKKRAHFNSPRRNAELSKVI